MSLVPVFCPAWNVACRSIFARKDELSLNEQALISNLVMCKRRSLPFLLKKVYIPWKYVDHPNGL
jgi:hypothetical protein